MTDDSEIVNALKALFGEADHMDKQLFMDHVFGEHISAEFLLKQLITKDRHEVNQAAQVLDFREKGKIVNALTH